MLESRPPSYVSYRWLDLGVDAGTLVEFWIEPRERRCHARGSPRAASPGSVRPREDWLQHREGNVEGWESELAAARTWVERRERHEHAAPTAVFSALADDTRWAILTRLGESPASASALARELPVSRQAIVKHLEVLRGAGLVEAETQGRELVHQALGGRLSTLARDLDRIAETWDRRLADLKRLAEEGG